MLHQVQVAEINGFEINVPLSKNYNVSGFLVIFKQRLQNHKVAKVEYVWECLPTIIPP